MVLRHAALQALDSKKYLFREFECEVECEGKREHGCQAQQEV